MQKERRLMREGGGETTNYESREVGYQEERRGEGGKGGKGGIGGD